MKFFMTVGLSVLSTSLWAVSGTADLKGTAEQSAIKGTAHFEETKEGLHVKAQVMGLPPGLHGFHIHEFGSCDELGKAAGSHYNPQNAPHGHLVKDGPTKAHAGDMGNIKADATGSAWLDMILPGVTLAGSAASVGGRAVVVHEKADDFGQPVGNAGGRIACGPILITGN